jgi:nucleoside-diphosphate-sugar epimerase
LNERFLITGAFGCIGAWATRLLVEEDVDVVAFDLGDDPYRLRLILSPEQLDRVSIVRGDVTDLDGLERVVAERDVTHVIHLAALLIPQVRENPHGAPRSTWSGRRPCSRWPNDEGFAACHTPARARCTGPERAAASRTRGDPATLYGVFKLANEATARVYWETDRVGSVGLRPYVVYGVGRDTGVTAGPSLAMQAASRGEGYRIGFGGRFQLQLARDAARTFIQAARAGHQGAPVFNLGGPVIGMDEIVKAIEAAAPEAAGKIAFDDMPLPFPEGVDAGGLEGARRLCTVDPARGRRPRDHRPLPACLTPASSTATQSWPSGSAPTCSQARS